MIMYQSESFQLLSSEMALSHRTLTPANSLQLVFGSFFSARVKKKKMITEPFLNHRNIYFLVVLFAGKFLFRQSLSLE